MEAVQVSLEEHGSYDNKDCIITNKFPKHI